MENEKLFRLVRGRAFEPARFWKEAIILEREWHQAKLNGWRKASDQTGLEMFREVAEEAVKHDYERKYHYRSRSEVS